MLRVPALGCFAGLGLIVFAASCGSSEASLADSPRTDDASASQPSGDAGTPPILATDAAPSDASGASDAAPDASLLGPQPPAGTTRCGYGTLTADEIRAACKLPPNFGPTPEDACDLTTSDGGRYEIWCGPLQNYVWAEIDALRAGAGVKGCPIANGGFFLHPNANYAYSSTTSAGAGGASATFDIPSPASLTPRRSIVVEATFGHEAPHGSVNIWVSGLDGACTDAGIATYARVAGVAVSWTK